jgi:hypothetical protein
MPGDDHAGAELTRTTQHAITYASRVASAAKERNARHRADNAELIKQFEQRRLAGSGTERTPSTVRDAAKRFRSAGGLVNPRLPDRAESVAPRRPKAAGPPRSGDDDEDFSQERIMLRWD